jgi:CheY-like chemotaxis protein
MSAAIKSLEAEKMAELGIKEFITKPFVSKDLYDTLQQYLPLNNFDEV